jgi:hypothetical protein
MIYTTIGMLLITLLLFIFAFVRVKTGSGIKDVKTIVVLMIVSSLSALGVMMCGIFVMSCYDTYTGFSCNYIENNVKANLVSISYFNFC